MYIHAGTNLHLLKEELLLLSALIRLSDFSLPSSLPFY